MHSLLYTVCCAQFGLAAQFPQRYTQSAMSGQALAGVLICVLRIITKEVYGTSFDGVRKSSLLYFGVTCFFMLLCAAGYMTLRQLPFVRYQLDEDFVGDESLRESLLADVSTADYLGRHRVGDYTCDHLAFTQDTIDWQVWLDVDEGPRLRKMVITYKLEDGAPQYTMWVTQFDMLDDAPDALFAFEPTPALRKIELRPISESPWEESQLARE